MDKESFDMMLLWPDEAATQAFAQRLARKAEISHAFIELEGDLGAGKTTLVRYLLRALGVQGRVKSPTYAVVESYEVPFPIFFNEVSSPIDSEESSRSKRILAIFHFDFYRFSDPREWEEAGFRDHFTAPGLKVAEWAVNARAALPLADVVIRLETLDDNARQATVAAQTALGQALLA